MRRIVARRIVRLSLATPPSTLCAPFDIVPNTFVFSLSQHHIPTFSPFRACIMHVLFAPPPHPPSPPPSSSPSSSYDIHLRLWHPCRTLRYVHRYCLECILRSSDHLHLANIICLRRRQFSKMVIDCEICALMINKVLSRVLLNNINALTNT